MNTEKMTIAPHVREIADSNAIRSATVELTRFTSDLGEWEVITQFLEMRGGGDWAEIFNRVEFFDQAEALEHMSDKVSWISNRSANSVGQIRFGSCLERTLPRGSGRPKRRFDSRL